MSTVIAIGGVTVTGLPRGLVAGRLVFYSKGSNGTFSFSVRGGPLPTLPNAYTGKSITVTVDGTLRFTGEVASGPHISNVKGLGWVSSYQCFDLRWLGDKLRHRDSNNDADQSAYNVSRDNDPQNWIATRAGRTVGQILTDVLTMPANANALNAYGIGQYSGLPTTPALPSATTTDLAALTWIPPGPCRFGGEKFLSAVESFLAQWAPTHVLRVKPDGTIRILDQRSFSAHTLTIDSDPILVGELSRDTSPCASRVELVGSALAEMFLFSTLSGNNGLSEAPFAHDSLTVAQAKAAWVPGDFRSPGLVIGAPGDDEGTCTCPSTTTVTVTSSNASQTWASNYWDQSGTGHLGTVFLAYSAGSTITTYAQRTIVSNTSLSAGGTSTLTLDRALPHLLFDHYVITGQAKGAAAVWIEYQLPSWAAAVVAPQSTFPFPYRASNTAAVTLTSTAIGTVLWSDSGSPPYTSASTGITVDPVTGFVRFAYPTFLLAGGKAPAEVRALIPIYVGVNKVASPQDSMGSPVYGGTFYSVEGVSRTLPLYVPAWRDPANATGMQAYADNLVDSVKNTVLEGSVTYLGKYSTAFEMGVALNVAGSTYTTGWESSSVSALPVIECALEWKTTPGTATSWETVLRCSNRMAHFSAEAFLKPDRTGVTLDFAENALPDLRFAGAAAIAGTAEAFNAGANLQANTQAQRDAAVASIPTTLADLGIQDPAEALRQLGQQLGG
jgi:hypothetical protein